MLRWLLSGSVAAVLTGLTLLLLTARYPSAGPVVVALTPTHGVHLGDLGIFAAWTLAMLALLGLVAQSGADRRPAGPGAGQDQP